MGWGLAGRLVLFSFSLLPPRFGYWKEESAIEAVLFAMGTYRRFRSLEDIASKRLWIKLRVSRLDGSDYIPYFFPPARVAGTRCLSTLN